MRFFRRGGEPSDHPPEQPQEPVEAADDVIGDEWRQGLAGRGRDGSTCRSTPRPPFTR